MKQSPLFFPLFLIIAGAVWLMNIMDLFPGTAAIIAGLMIAAGILVFVLDGYNKQSLVTAPLLMYIGAAIYLQDEYHISPSVLFALGMMLLGSLMLLARSNAVPVKNSGTPPPPAQS